MVKKNLSAIEKHVQKAQQLLLAERAPSRMVKHDASLWNVHVDVQAQIRQSLGWLDVIKPMLTRWPSLVAFREALARDGYTHAVLLGMGGSSLISILWTQVFPPGVHAMTLEVLDSTDPEVVEACRQRVPLDRTVFLVASKSGTTTEPNDFHQFFWAAVQRQGLDPAPHFVAITDPDTRLARQAKAQRWREVFLNPADIGGRYSALSLFGMVPAALLDLDGIGILKSAEQMRQAIATDTLDNPGLELGAILGGSVQAGRDKVTLVFSPRLRAFATWLEQLLAESTGKSGTGVIPVTELALGDPTQYGHDRLFVSVQWAGDPPEQQWESEPPHPWVQDRLEQLCDLGAEFVRWEVATALAGRVLGINPFDQPNVQESKDNTREVLETYRKTGFLPEINDVPSLLADSPALVPLLEAWLDHVQAGEYAAIMAYLPYGDAMDRGLRALQTFVRDRTRMAVTVGYGPRFLHSTGQLHKGGRPMGRFLQLTTPSDRVPPLEVPGQGYTFNVLIQAQALGDLRALASRHRPLLAVNLGRDPVAGLSQLLNHLKEVLQ